METSISKFQFKGYRINRSLIELDENSNFENLKISFAVSGLVKRVENLFILNLSVKIKNDESNLKIEVDTIANFLFEKVENIDDINF
jgi:preprotein translocase subunit SecB